jgi:hypothetical protein
LVRQVVEKASYMISKASIMAEATPARRAEDEAHIPVGAKVTWPKGHQFAFTIVDDTDFSTVKNVKPVYDLLASLGMRTTKTAWMFRGKGPAFCEGTTCEDKDYLNWLLSLKSQGFEIAFHNAAPSTSPREQTRLALSRFRQLFGPDKLLFSNHTHCLEDLYWGDNRLSGWRRTVYNLVNLGKRRGISRGHLPGDPLFWGDLCQQEVLYVRNFVFDNLDSLAVCPEQPYHDPQKPFVNFWFTSADGGTINRFLENFTMKKLQRLADGGGLCIAYMHFANGFMDSKEVNAEFQKRMRFLAGLNGWFVPASQALEHLRGGAGTNQRTISPQRLQQLETRWLLEKLFKGTT